MPSSLGTGPRMSWCRSSLLSDSGCGARGCLGPETMNKESNEFMNENTYFRFSKKKHPQSVEGNKLHSTAPEILYFFPIHMTYVLTIYIKK